MKPAFRPIRLRAVLEYRQPASFLLPGAGLKADGIPGFILSFLAQTTFTNVARDAGLLEVKRYLSLGVAWGDYDNDGKFVSP